MKVKNLSDRSSALPISINIPRSQIILMEREFRRYIAYLENNGLGVKSSLYYLIEELNIIGNSPQKEVEITDTNVSENLYSHPQLLIPQNLLEKIHIKFSQNVIRLIYSTYLGYLQHIIEEEPDLKSYRLHVREKIKFFKAFLKTEE